MDEKKKEKDWFKINIFMAELFVTLGMVFLAVTVLNSINLWSAVVVFGILALICGWFAKISARPEKSKND